MRQLRLLFVVLIIACLSSGCDGLTLFVSAPLPGNRTSPTAPHPIVLGEIVNGIFLTPEVCFDLKAPRSGVLFVRITWDRRNGDIDLAFMSTVLSVTTHDASIIGTVTVVSGQNYRIAVVGDRGPVPFTLTTSMQ